MTYVQNNGRITTAATENPMTAPEKIWAWQYHDENDEPDNMGEWYTQEVGLDGDETEYIRADIHRQARNAALREAHDILVVVPAASIEQEQMAQRCQAAILSLIDRSAPDHIPDAGKMVPVQQAAKALLCALHSCDTEAQAIADRIAGPVGCLPSIPDAVQVLDDADTIIRAALRAIAEEDE